MPERVLPINLPLPDLSGEDALALAEFLFELAQRIEASYREPIKHHYHTLDQYRAEQCYRTLFGIDSAPLQLELFDDLEAF
jgi:hypothetical protein